MFVSSQPETKAVHLSPEHEATIKATLPLVGGKINEITPVFYKKMFTAHPELIADTFNRGNQKQGEQQKALAASIASFASMLVDPEAPDPVAMLARVGHKHVSLGITKDQYQIVHDNLFAAIVEVLGADVVTPDVAEAWDAVYWLMADVLVNYESDLYQSNNLEAGDVFRDVTVTSKKQLSDNVYEFELTSKDGALVAPKPGQYTSVGVKLDDGARQLRQYSLLAGDKNSYRIAVQIDGEVSTFLRDRVAVGDQIETTIAAGDLVLSDGDHPVALISQGIGSTPMVGMLGHLAEVNATRPVTVLHADDSAESYAQREEAQLLVDKLSDAQLSSFYRSEGDRLEVSGRLPEDADIYLCGGNGFLKNVREQLTAAGVDESRVHFELFSPNDWLV